jgi:hypothetical protein
MEYDSKRLLQWLLIYGGHCSLCVHGVFGGPIFR